MFTGIIEALGKVEQIEENDSNVDFTISCPFTDELSIDQSVAHNGVCLTVIAINENKYTVTAIDETLEKSNLKQLKVGDAVNLERCMKMNGRLDGHIVQGHVDTVAECKSIHNQNGSWKFTFTYQSNDVTVEKGSVTINGISLTVVDSRQGEFSVAIIPYTYKNTNLKDIKKGDFVNIEFDIIGKYVKRLLNN